MEILLSDRPLLDCPEFRLQEDVVVGGRLIVYYAQRAAIKSDDALAFHGGDDVATVTLGIDMEFRFSDLSEDLFLCPGWVWFRCPERRRAARLERGA